MNINLDIPKDLEAQLTADAQARRMPVAELARNLLLEHYEEERNDLRIAEARLNDPQTPLSVSELRKNLGLDN